MELPALRRYLPGVGNEKDGAEMFNQNRMTLIKENINVAR